MRDWIDSPISVATIKLDQELEIRPIKFRGPEFAEWLDLRSRILREPLGLFYSEADIDAERDSHHICAFDSASGTLLGGLILADQTVLGDGPNSVWSVYKMRQVAVDSEQQGHGIGTALVKFAENYSAEKEVEKIILNAREAAVPFYLQLGYTITSEVFEEVGIPHFEMQKSITPN